LTVRLGVSGVPVAADQAAKSLVALAWAPILSGIPAADLRRLARTASPVVAQLGEILFRAGDELGDLLLIQAGAVKIANEFDGHSLPIAIAGPGDFIGASSAADDPRTTCTATAIEHSELIAVRRHVLREVLEHHDQAARQLRAVLEWRRNLAGAVAGNQGRLTAPRNARVISVHSPRGGAGTTTMAVSLARALSRANPRNVVLVDLSLPFNQCAFLTCSLPTSSLARAQQAPAQHREDVLLSAVFAHPSGFGLLAGVLRPEESDLVTVDSVAQAIQVLRREFAFVVLDVGSRNPGLVRVAFDRSDDVLIVMTPDLPALRDVAILRGSLGSLVHRMRVIVNHPLSTKVLDTNVMRGMLDFENVSGVEHDRSLLDAASRGDLLSVSQHSSPVGRAASSLATELASSSRQAGHNGRARESQGPSWMAGRALR
jgi:pilus assembly protein CpaE